MKNSFFDALAASRWGTVLLYGYLALSGWLFTFAFPAADQGWLALFALIPPLSVTCGRSVKTAFWRGFVWGWFWSFGAFFWIREIFFLLPYVFALILGVFPAVWCAVTAFLWRNLAWSVEDRKGGSVRLEKGEPFSGKGSGLFFMFASAAAWVVTEWTRSWIATGMPWNFLGTTQWRNVSLIQICEVTGIYGISFVLAFVNLGLFLTYFTFRRIRKEKKYIRPLPLLAAFALILTASYVGTRLLQRFRRHPRKCVPFQVSMIQCSLTQRRFASAEQNQEAADVCFDLTGKALSDPAGKPDVVIWPETAVPHPFFAATPFGEFCRARMDRMLDQYGVPVILGTLDYREADNPDGYEVFNGAVLLKHARSSPADAYYKVHRVPFGEYVPFGDEFPALVKWVGMGRNLTPGKECRPLIFSDRIRIGTSVCFESVFSRVTRRQVLNGANLLLVIANDAWYPESWEPEQHFVNALFRTVETRLSMLRCGNGSPTCLIGPDGIPDFKKYDPALRNRDVSRKQVLVPLDPRPTFYVRYGDVFVFLCMGILFCALLPAFRDEIQYRMDLTEEKKSGNQS